MSDATPSKANAAEKASPAKAARTQSAAAKRAARPAKKSSAGEAAATPARKTAKRTSTSAESSAAKRTSSPAKSSAAKRASTPAKEASARRTTGKNAKRSTDAAEAPASKYFKQAQVKARRALTDPDEMRRVAEEASKTGEHRSGPFSEVMEDFKALIRLVVAYSRGHYRDIPLDQFLAILAALIYVASPIDVVPDALPGGFVDDVVVLGWVLKAVRSELNTFREWELGKE